MLATAKYLNALNSLFERTLLGSKTRFFHAEGTGIQRLDEGFQYFRDWAEELVSSGEFGDGVESKKFIAWQVRVSHVHNVLFNAHSVVQYPVYVPRLTVIGLYVTIVHGVYPSYCYRLGISFG